MTQEEKTLLLQDLCGRLLYGVFVEYDYGDGVKRATKFHGNYLYLMMIGSLQWKDFKPYLRPMSSMTEKELKEFSYTILQQPDLDAVRNWQTISIDLKELSKVLDWLNKKMLDYRDLIEKGLALEAPEDMYNV